MSLAGFLPLSSVILTLRRASVVDLRQEPDMGKLSDPCVGVPSDRHPYRDNLRINPLSCPLCQR